MNEARVKQKKEMGRANVKSALLMFRMVFTIAFTWLMLLVLLIAASCGKEMISVGFSLKLLAFSAGASAIFCGVFSELILKGKSFIFRMTIFMVAFLPFEVACFYWMGIFEGSGNAVLWLLFVGTFVLSYVISVVLDRVVFAKRGEVYTQQLKAYQNERRQDYESDYEGIS
ncbi:MAG: hypothetical protein J6T47_04730 [Lachnospiraceae bacterium]|nr:hypothetical protein [Lachnospiraceae bacterium]